MSRDELAVLDGGKCILQLRGVRPFLSDKYELTQHPNYKLTSDYDPKNALDIEKFVNRKEKIHPDDTFIMVDAINSIWSIVGYTVLLCFTLFKTGSVARSILGAH